MLRSGFLTSEFWVSLAALAGKIVVLLVSLNYIGAAQQENITKAITDLLLAVGTLVALTQSTKSYVKNRTELKMASLGYGPPMAAHRKLSTTCPSCQGKGYIV